ncbi:aspartate kinase [Longibacter sp.]|uniref:aspartate kinase n=1 Tax=Longibacter sp. TaxID=2045415 RepID=UPI003EB84D17
MPTAASPAPNAPSSWSDVPLPAHPAAVLKFGGSSVGSPASFSTVVDVVSDAVADGPIVVVASALARVTRQLSSGLEAFTTHHHDPGVVDDLVSTLRDRHLDHAAAALGPSFLDAYRLMLDEHLSRLRTVFDRVRNEGFSPALRDAVLATGEQMSVPILTLALRDAGHAAPHCDATKLMVTDDAFGGANVHLRDTADRVRRWYADLGTSDVPVVAGFIGATRSGTVTTLGFEGSDYSAALFTAMLGAGSLTRFTDVDGLYTADPNTDENAERLDRIDMEEAYARTESGALGMHPKTLRPLVHAGIPMQVRSILDPSVPGTCILPSGADVTDLIPRVPDAA